jgi:hypothetical protein
MLPEDRAELQRLTDMLRDINAKLDRDSPLREGLIMADLALHYVFTNGLRADLEQGYSKPAGKPLTESQLAELDAEIARLDKMCKDPEA